MFKISKFQQPMHYYYMVRFEEIRNVERWANVVEYRIYFMTQERKPTCTNERTVCNYLVPLTVQCDPNIQECTTQGCIHGGHLKHSSFPSSSFRLQMPKEKKCILVLSAVQILAKEQEKWIFSCNVSHRTLRTSKILIQVISIPPVLWPWVSDHLTRVVLQNLQFSVFCMALIL